MNGLGLYVHVPFCAAKCAYCDFPSFAGQMHLREAYVDRLEQEIAQRAESLSHPEADSIYIGGGTPSLLKPAQIARVLSALRRHFPLSADCELSCEANPGMLSPAFLEALLTGGINRLSLGAQSADPALLTLIGRQHSWAKVEEAVALARRMGLNNINIDLIMGIPGQGLTSWQHTLECALSLEPDHLSCYGLILEEGTPLEARVRAGELHLPDEAIERDMYDHTLSRLAQAGYAPYEISNFARPGHACRHNIACWQRRDYLGFGSASHSLEQGHVRRANPPDIGDYLMGKPATEELIGLEDAMFESLMLGLRMTRGLDIADFERRYGRSFHALYGEAAEQNQSRGLVYYEKGHAIRLTRQGMDIMNRVLLDFMH